MYVDKVNKMRYQKVLESLRTDYIFKTISSGLIWLWATIQDMFATNAELMLLLLIVLGADWISGNINAKRKGLEIKSFGWRQSVVKLIEYTVFLLILSGVGNVFGSIEGGGWISEFFTHVNNIEVFGYFYIILTEVKSVAENLSGTKGTINKLFKEIKERIFNGDDVNI